MAAEGVNAEMYFIRDGEYGYGSPNLPSELVIFTVDQDGGGLDSLCHLFTNWGQIEVQVFPEPGLVIIADLSNTWIRDVFVIPFEDPPGWTKIDLRDKGDVRRVRYFDEPSGPGFLRIDTSWSLSDVTNIRQTADIEIPLNDIAPRTTSVRATERRLPGLGGPGDRGIVPLRGRLGGDLRALIPDFELEDPNVPDSVVRYKGCSRWNLIANEASYRAFLSVPSSKADSARELVIFNRDSETWHSLLVPGEATKPIRVNGWLAGRVADDNPKSDRAAHRGYPSILRDEIIMINPMTMQTRRASRQGDWEVLWIGADTVWYRQDDELYRGRLTENDIVDDELMAKDFRVRSINWVFEGKK